MRVVSLLPSATEIVLLLEAGDTLVGHVETRDLSIRMDASPPALNQGTGQTGEVSGRPTLVRPSTSSGRVLDRLDTSLFVDLDPDVVIAGSSGSFSRCEVEGVIDAIKSSGGQKPVLLWLEPHSIEEIVDDVIRVAEALRCPERGMQCAVALRTKILEVQEWVTPFVDHGTVVGFLEGFDPLMVAGHWTVQMIERAGGVHPWNASVSKPNAGAACGPQQAERIAGPSITVDAEAFTSRLPEVVIVCPRDADLAQSEAAARNLMQREWFQSTPAARTDRVYAVDGRASFHQPGPRIVEAFRFIVGLMDGRSDWMSAVPWSKIGG